MGTWATTCTASSRPSRSRQRAVGAARSAYRGSTPRGRQRLHHLAFSMRSRSRLLQLAVVLATGIPATGTHMHIGRMEGGSGNVLVSRSSLYILQFIVKI